MPIITFLSDFGTDDVFVGLCHAVMVRHAPAARVVDLTHAVPRGDVLTGASRLADCVSHTGPAVHLAVVDPGVGTARLPVVLRAEQDERAPSWLVGPDNGLLVPAAERLGGIRQAWAITASGTAGVSRTFHGRDVFSPTAAMLADGKPPGDLGRRLDVSTLVRLPETANHAARHTLTTTVRDVDIFGNVQLFASPPTAAEPGLGGDLLVTAHERVTPATRVETFADLAEGGLGVLVDSFGWLALAVRGGSAAAQVGLRRGDVVRLTRART